MNSGAAESSAGTPIIFFNRFYAPDHSATAQILSDLAEHLADTGHDVTVVTSRAIYGQEDGLLAVHELRRGVAVVRTATPARRRGMAGRIVAYLTYYIMAFFEALRRARRGSILVVKTDPPLLSVPIAIAASLRGATLVHWVQDLYPEIAGAYGMRLADGPIGKFLAAVRNWSFRRAATVVAIGDLMAERVERMGVARDRITVIPNWSNDIEITPSLVRSPSLRRDWNIPEAAFVLEYSGNLGRAHEYETLLDAATVLRDRLDIVFLFIGGGHVSDQLAARVAELGLTSFRFAPYQPRERLSESLGAGDAHWVSLRPEFEGLVVPSKVFGICAAARPVIAVCAMDGELIRLLEPGHACLVAVPGDAVALVTAITTLADDRVRGDKMGAVARDILDRHYTKARTLDRWRVMLDHMGIVGAAQQNRTSDV
ncbi:glycosyltransferase family 4 protein [Sphingomonas sp. ERG5]|uniref:glycosyltransferase family 4 protein n=1 Tax=Sphingomonas sp. ERG5 TaxID=1381597 RepID=UPI00068F3D59|nr:glycosyltransferase family 4 protein [Sphingomonas sp. ERG5]